MKYDYENKSLEQLRLDILNKKYDDVEVTPNMIDDIVKKIRFEEAQQNKEDFIFSLLKLKLLTDANSKLPYEINKQKILEYVKEELINKKAFEIVTMKAGIKNYDPIHTIRQIEVYELLLEYLEKDKTITDNSKKTLCLK